MKLAVWAVIHGNHYVLDAVDSLWTTEDLANKRIEKLSDEWHAVEWVVGDNEDDEVLSDG